MRYQVTQSGSTVVLRDEHRAETTIDTAVGNTVTSFRVLGQSRLELLASGTWSAERGERGHAGGIPILFPFPNRVEHGRFRFDDKDYTLEVDGEGNHNHGFVRGRPWSILAFGASNDEGAWMTASIQLDAFPDVYRQYPFRCTLTVRTLLRDGALIQEAQARNDDTVPLPMGYGIHPWFLTDPAGTRQRTQVRVGARDLWILREHIPTGEVTRASGRLALEDWRALGDDTYDDALTNVVRRSDSYSESAVRYPGSRIEIRVEASPEFREWVIYAPRDRDVVCLEPYTCAPNAVNMTRNAVDGGLISLGPGEVWSGITRITAMG
jgi:aldose 1-epimerase